MVLLHALVIYSIAASLVYLAAIAVSAIVLALRAGGRRDRVVDHEALSASRFTMPVSLLLRATEGVGNHSSAIAALLDLNYPELEVIVIAEAVSSAGWESLKQEWQLEAREFFYRQSLSTAPVRMMYRSGRDPRLLVADKAPGTAADAWNCGVNLARFRYVSAIDARIVFDGDALLRAMTAPMREPATIVGATSHVEIADPEASDAKAAKGAKTAMSWRFSFQRLASFRSLMESRLVWRARRGALGPRDALLVWRRDAILQAGGFSTRAADPDLDMMVRLQTRSSTGPEQPAGPCSIAGHVVRTGEIFGHMAPRPSGELLRVVARRQLAALQALFALVRLHTTVPGMVGFFFVSEILTPFAEAWAVSGTIGAAAAGWLPWIDVGLVLLLLSLGNASVGAAALLLRGSVAQAADASGLARLLLVAPFEILITAPAATYARVRGACALVRTQR